MHTCMYVYVCVRTTKLTKKTHTKVFTKQKKSTTTTCLPAIVDPTTFHSLPLKTSPSQTARCVSVSTVWTIDPVVVSLACVGPVTSYPAHVLGVMGSPREPWIHDHIPDEPISRPNHRSANHARAGNGKKSFT